MRVSASLSVMMTSQVLIVIMTSQVCFFQIGLTIMWDVGTRVYVKLEPRFKSQVCGLCGNFDGNALNDFTTRQGWLLCHNAMT